MCTSSDVTNLLLATKERSAQPVPKPVQPVVTAPSLSSSPTNSESNYRLSLSPSNGSTSSTPDSTHSFPFGSHTDSLVAAETTPNRPPRPTEAIEVPEVIAFDKSCCVGGVGVASIGVKNVSGDRWVQGHLQCLSIHHDDNMVSVLHV